jgi:hypothetical protein
MPDDVKRRVNWFLWAGFVLNLLAFFSFFLFFARFPVTRDFPWANLLLFLIAEGLLAVGLFRAFARAVSYRGKIMGPVLSGLSALVLFAFVFIVFVMARQLPASPNAPRVGAKAPDFTLPDVNNNLVSLAELLTTPQNGAATKGVLLVFYRGYW